MKKNELNYKQLKNICNPNVFKFETTDELDDTEPFIEDYYPKIKIEEESFEIMPEEKGYTPE